MNRLYNSAPKLKRLKYNDVPNSQHVFCTSASSLRNSLLRNVRYEF